MFGLNNKDSKPATVPALPAKSSNAPSHVIYYVRDYGSENENSNWTPIGVAWTNRDGSLNMKFNLFPAELSQGRICVRERRADDQPSQEAA